MLFLIFLISCVTALDNEHATRYQDYSVISTIPTTPAQLSALHHLYLNDVEHQTNFWSAPAAVGRRVSLGVPKQKSANVVELLKSIGSTFILEDINLQELIEEERRSNSVQFTKGNNSASFDINKYHQLTEIEEYLRQLELDYPDLVERLIIGETEEKREIVALKIASGTSESDDNKGKPAILIDAGFHAREWIAPATAIYIIHTLVAGYDSDESVKNLVDSYDWYIMPVMNPDGYDYTWTTDRLWRKNRSKTRSAVCFGADPNRNFAIGFGGFSTSDSPCSEVYHGPSAFSEAESQALKQLTEENSDRIQIAITLHAFGQMWMSPWGYKYDKPDDYDTMVSAAKKAVEALESVDGSEFEVGTISEVIYAVGGGSTDWQYTVTNSPYMYSIELRPLNSYLGFVTSNTEIQNSGEEMWKAISTLANEVLMFD